MHDGSMRVLVTGGAGFVGSHLCDSLVARGDHVICLDNFHTGSEDNVSHLLGLPNFEMIAHDVSEPIELTVDRIFNLACPASPIHYQYDPVRTVRTSVLGAINMLDLARAQGARILQASTSEVYGDPKVHPQVETYWGNVNPIGLRACYDEGKRCAETLFFDYSRQYGVDVKVARIFNTYGPRMAINDGRVVSNFVVQALSGQPITLYGEGLQTRSFCYVSDLVAGLMKLMDSPKGFTGPVNLGNPGEFTIAELAQLAVAKTGATSELVYRALPDDDPKQRRPDISLAKAALGWAPTIPLDEGLDHTIAYFAARLRSGDAG